MLKTAIAATAILGGVAFAGAASAAPLPFPVLHAQGSEQALSNHDIFAAPGNAGVNSPVAGAPEDFNGGSEFTEFFYNTNAHGNAIVGWQLTPGGVSTGLCVADPGPGYGANDAIVLRACNGLIWQRFRVLNQTDGYAALQNVASNQFITDDGTGNGLLGVADNRPCVVGIPCPPSAGITNTFGGEMTQQWRWTGGTHLARSLSVVHGTLGTVTPSPAPADFTAQLTITEGFSHGTGTVTASAAAAGHPPVTFSITTPPHVSYVSIDPVTGKVAVHGNHPGTVPVTVTATDHTPQSESVTFTLRIS